MGPPVTPLEDVRSLAGRKDAKFSADRCYRWVLSRPVAAPLLRGAFRPLPWILLNPSVADEERGDLTAAKVCGYTMRIGQILGVAYTDAIVGNLNAWISTKPGGLKAETAVGAENDTWIRAILTVAAEHPNPIAIVAWGTWAGPVPGRAQAIVNIAAEVGVRLMSLGKNRDGSPPHPSRTPYAKVADLARWAPP